MQSKRYTSRDECIASARAKLGDKAKLGKQYDIDTENGTHAKFLYYVWACALVDGKPYANEEAAFDAACRKADKTAQDVKFEYVDGSKTTIEPDLCVVMDIKRAPDIAVMNLENRKRSKTPTHKGKLNQQVLALDEPCLPLQRAPKARLSFALTNALLDLVFRKEGATRAELIKAAYEMCEPLAPSFRVWPFLKANEANASFDAHMIRNQGRGNGRGGRYYAKAKANHHKPKIKIAEAREMRLQLEKQ
jgi:hypothetical protein